MGRLIRALMRRLDVERQEAKGIIRWVFLYLFVIILSQMIAAGHFRIVSMIGVVSIFGTGMFFWMRCGRVVDFALVFNPLGARDIIIRYLQLFFIIQIVSTVVFMLTPGCLRWYALGAFIIILGFMLIGTGGRNAERRIGTNE